jgi:hypothetical protein
LLVEAVVDLAEVAEVVLAATGRLLVVSHLVVALLQNHHYLAL